MRREGREVGPWQRSQRAHAAPSPDAPPSEIVELPVPRSQVVQGKFRIGRAWIGNDEHLGFTYVAVLQPQFRALADILAVAEVAFVGHQAVETDQTRPVP